MHGLDVIIKRNEEAANGGRESETMTYEKVKELADAIEYDQGMDCLKDAYWSWPAKGSDVPVAMVQVPVPLFLVNTLLGSFDQETMKAALTCLIMEGLRHKVETHSLTELLGYW